MDPPIDSLHRFHGSPHSFDGSLIASFSRFHDIPYRWHGFLDKSNGFRKSVKPHPFAVETKQNTSGRILCKNAEAVSLCEIQLKSCIQQCMRERSSSIDLLWRQTPDSDYSFVGKSTDQDCSTFVQCQINRFAALKISIPKDGSSTSDQEPPSGKDVVCRQKLWRPTVLVANWVKLFTRKQCHELCLDWGDWATTR